MTSSPGVIGRVWPARATTDRGPSKDILDFAAKHSISVSLLSKMSGVARATIYRIAHGKNVRIDTLHSLADACSRLLHREVAIAEILPEVASR
jgi:predicted transcriptional regulator